MGMYLDPGNSGFKEVISNEYVDKTGIIGLINQCINTTDKLICVSRPRRFGKSYTAKTLCAYYDHTCDSHELFAGYEASTLKSYEEHINKYQVICIDVSQLMQEKSEMEIGELIQRKVTDELLLQYPKLAVDQSFSKTLFNAVELTGRKFVMIIDEWDAPIREEAQVSKKYLGFLKSIFKGTVSTTDTFAAVYMTGILPIKKDGTQSAVSDFREFTILDPQRFAPYTGFNEDEVRRLCEKYHMDFSEAKRWYDGYSFPGAESVYNPFSVMMAIKSGEFESYWKRTSVADPLISFININIKKYNGQPSDLGADILKLIAGEQLKVNTSRFNNDFHTFNTEDDVLTLLTHLGYLAYDKATKRVRIPNEEVRLEFNELLEEPQYSKLSDLILRSEKLLNDTLAGDGDAVAEAIKNVRATNYAPMYYNNEQSLRYAVKFAYIICVDRYMKVEELPSGSGLADVVYLPKSDTALPALVVELKWDESADSAIDQIKRNDYPAVLADYCGEILLVGINYNSKTKEHTCKIERIDK